MDGVGFDSSFAHYADHETLMTGTDVYLTLPRLGTNLEGIEV
jgi:hypothetical protein